VSLSLYRSWRPRSFDDLVGQDAVVRTLRTALSSGKLAHAYLFSGPRGSGKTSAAKILARCIDCVHGPTPDPDNTCENCLAILAGTALDVLEIDAASNRGIDEIRALRESVKFAPAAMRYKVFIIDEAHMLTREGANAFLKTLEEPPAHAIFILATTAPEALPPTILSRCQRYAFRRIPIPVMIGRMREIANAEGIPIGDDALGALAYRADGGLRDALTMLEQVASFAGSESGPIDAATVEAAFGTTGRVYARALVEALRAGDAARALNVIDEASDAGSDMQGLIRTSVAEFRNLLVARVDPALLSQDLAADDAAQTRAAAAATPQAKIVRALRLLADALAAGRVSGNPRLELETAALRYILQAEDPTVEALATRVAELEARLAGGAAPSPQAGATSKAEPLGSKAEPARPKPEPVGSKAEPAAVKTSAEAGKPAARAAAPAPDVRPRASSNPHPTPSAESGDAGAVAAPPVPSAEPAVAPATPAGKPTLQQIRALWDQIRTRAYERAMPLKAQLSRATVDAFEGETVTIGLVDAMQAEMARAKTAVVEEALSEVMRTPLRVAFRSGGPTPGTRPAPKKPEAAHPPESPARSAARSDGPAPGAQGTLASAAEPDGEADLMTYARLRFSEAPAGTEMR
jgi:DNA polymerase-3 subunit gamma/tau